MGTVSSAPADQALYQRLVERRPEIEQTVLTRVYSVSDPTSDGDTEYVAGLKVAVSAAVGYALAGIEAGGQKPATPPAELFTQARHAARSGVSLDTVLRRYLAGHTLLCDFVMQAAGEEELSTVELRRALRTESALADRLIAAVAEEYNREADVPPTTPEQRRVELIKSLLAGQPVDAAKLTYELDAWHLGVVAAGSGAGEAIRALAATLDRRPLLARPQEGTIWAWLGGRDRTDVSRTVECLSKTAPAHVVIAVGEPAHGLTGLRLTHRQAVAALPIARRGPQAVVRYADVALPASMLTDDLLLASLRQIYLAPLERERNGGRALLETLRAYIAAERNSASAAAALGITRQTVHNRLRVVEERLERSLNACIGEIEIALQLEEFDGGAG